MIILEVSNSKRSFGWIEKVKESIANGVCNIGSLFTEYCKPTFKRLPENMDNTGDVDRLLCKV